ncbi:MAG: hypothetical protein AAF585_05610, partial [Verrucomicrobiota bacterium]
MIRRFLTGNITKAQLSRVIIPASFVMMLFWLISRVLFGASGQWYLWEQNAISNQGNIRTNPIGCWFFVVGTVLASFNIVILLKFVFNRLGKKLRWLSWIFLLSGLTGAFGLFLVGVTPEGSGRVLTGIHMIGSQLAFTGLGSCAALSWLIGIIRVATKQPWPSAIQVFALLGLVFQIGSMIFFTKSGTWIQWTSFNAILIWLVGLFLIVPD